MAKKTTFGLKKPKQIFYSTLSFVATTFEPEMLESQSKAIKTRIINQRL